MIRFAQTVKSGDTTNREAGATKYYWSALFDTEPFYEKHRNRIKNIDKQSNKKIFKNRQILLRFFDELKKIITFVLLMLNKQLG